MSGKFSLEGSFRLRRSTLTGLMKATFGLDATSRSYDNAQKGEPRDWEPRVDLTASTIRVS